MAKARRADRDRKDLEWDFRSFPTIFAFFVGSLFGFLFLVITALPDVVFVVSLFGTSFCAAHAISRWFRNRSIDKRMQQAEEDERERRALAARAANSLEGEVQSNARRRRRRR